MEKIYDEFIRLAMAEKIGNSFDFLRIKKDLCKKLGVQPPTNADLREHYEKMIAGKKIARNLSFEKTLLSKKIRTESGVAVVAVLTKSYPCPGKCVYCPTEKNMPKSYLSNEPAVMRAISAKFNPYKQVQNRLRALELNGHQIDKIELIVMGGTFSYLPKSYQTKFIRECFRACNEYGKSKVRKVHKVHKVQKSKKSIDELLFEQKRNEKSRCRIIGLTLETRPDYIDAREILNFRKLGCTRVELGVQSIYDDVLKINKRGHDVAKTIAATKLLKDAGFKINYHIMPGMLGSTVKKDLAMFRELFSNPAFRPDMLKIYPTVVTKNSALYNIWKKSKNNRIQNTAAAAKCMRKKYVPLTNRQFEKMILEIKNKMIPPFVRIARLVRDVPTSSIIAGPTISNLRQIIAKDSHCQCIRCREVRADYDIKEKIILDRIDYDASDGKEIFLQYITPPSPSGRGAGGEGKQKLFALLRLRIPYCHSGLDPESNALPIHKTKILNQVQDDKLYKLFPALKNSALIREVHTYGKLTKIDTQDKNSPQHIGLGKKLILEAEKIAREEFGLKKIAIISGIGVRGYYRKLGYKLQDTYMVKKLK